MADWSKILTSEAYATLLASIKGMIYDVARGLDPATTTPANVPTDAIRWSTANYRWERYNGTAWVTLSATHAIGISGNAATVTNGLYTTNIGTLVPSPTGAGASGTWNIAAASANTLNAANDYSVRTITASNAICGTSPNGGTSGALVLRDASGDPDAVYLQATNNARTVQYGYFKFNKDGTITASGTITSVFPAGTRLLFAQASAPTGWTQVTDDTANNRMLRVVSGAGGGVGGSHDPVVNSVVPAHTHGFSTGYVSNDHVHYTTTGGRSADHSHSFSIPTGQNGAGTPGTGVMNYPYAVGTTGYSTGGESTDHSHGGWSGGINANHTHSGSTDNGSSQTNWTPRYINMILCSKN